jgi:hypothetical protein
LWTAAGPPTPCAAPLVETSCDGVAHRRRGAAPSRPTSPRSSSASTSRGMSSARRPDRLAVCMGWCPNRREGRMTRGQVRRSGRRAHVERQPRSAAVVETQQSRWPMPGKAQEVGVARPSQPLQPGGRCRWAPARVRAAARARRGTHRVNLDCAPGLEDPWRLAPDAAHAARGGATRVPRVQPQAHAVSGSSCGGVAEHSALRSAPSHGHAVLRWGPTRRSWSGAPAAPHDRGP